MEQLAKSNSKAPHGGILYVSWPRIGNWLCSCTLTRGRYDDQFPSEHSRNLTKHDSTEDRTHMVGGASSPAGAPQR